MADNRNRVPREDLDSRSREELRREAREARERMRRRRNLFIWFLLIIGIVLLIGSTIWKRKLMKEEQALIAGEKETTV